MNDTYRCPQIRQVLHTPSAWRALTWSSQCCSSPATLLPPPPPSAMTTMRTCCSPTGACLPPLQSGGQLSCCECLRVLTFVFSGIGAGRYAEVGGVRSMFRWQRECLSVDGGACVLRGGNLIYSAVRRVIIESILAVLLLSLIGFRAHCCSALRLLLIVCALRL